VGSPQTVAEQGGRCKGRRAGGRQGQKGVNDGTREERLRREGRDKGRPVDPKPHRATVEEERGEEEEGSEGKQGEQSKNATGTARTQHHQSSNHSRYSAGHMIGRCDNSGEKTRAVEKDTNPAMLLISLSYRGFQAPPARAMASRTRFPCTCNNGQKKSGSFSKYLQAALFLCNTTDMKDCREMPHHASHRATATRCSSNAPTNASRPCVGISHLAEIVQAFSSSAKAEPRGMAHKS